MQRVKIILVNLVALTATSLILRTVGMSFQVYLSKQIGPSGIGLLQLIMSIYFLAATFAISGIRLAATRLVAEELGMNREAGAKKAIKICLCYSLIFSTVFAITLFFCANFIGTLWLGDTRAILSLRILALSLPFLAICAVMGGYFTAVRRVLKLSAVMMAEQVFRIAATVACILALLPRGLEYACAGIAIGACIGEIASCLLLFILYSFDIRQYKNRVSSPDLPPRMFRIALPVAFSAYVTSIIRTLQQTLIPHGLKKSGASSESALATFGTIQGMAIPLLMFPAVLLYAISDLIVPELAECQAQGRPNRLSYIINRVISLGLISSIGVMSIFFRFSAELGRAVYNSSEAGYYLKILAPLIPVMYMDSIVDGMLKGIGQQVPSMAYNIFESLLGVTLIYLLLPEFAVAGYIFTLFLTRTLNFGLSLNRLRKFVSLKITVGAICKMLFCILNALIISNLVFYTLHITWLPLCIFTTAAAYYLLLRLMSCITAEDLAWFKSIFS